MKISIVVIGDEILIGQVTDTNSGYIARGIAGSGWEVDNIRTVADSAPEIRAAVTEAFTKTPVVLTTGGLGPTKDDITKQVLCDIFGGTLREDTSVTENIKEVFRKRGLTMNPLTAAQAMVPTSARVIQNHVGTAPVMWFETSEPKRVLVAMPGVPFEMEHNFTRHVFPQLLEAFPSDSAVRHRSIMVAGITESSLAMRLDTFEKSLPDGFHLAYLPKPGIIRLRLDGSGHDIPLLDRHMDHYATELIKQCGSSLLYDGDASPAQILLHMLERNNLTFATAESCTGGNISRLLTSVAGASRSMLGAIVAYSNNVKEQLLGVKPATLAKYGAVSTQVAEQMAAGARRATGASMAVATSGIAGPGGGTREKPVGTVCIAVAGPDSGITSHTYHFPGNRERVVERASTTALLMAISRISK